MMEDFLSLIQNKRFSDPYFRFKLFSSAKFNEKKFEEDMENSPRVLQLTGLSAMLPLKPNLRSIYNQKGNLSIGLKSRRRSQILFSVILPGKEIPNIPTLFSPHMMGINKGRYL